MSAPDIAARLAAMRAAYGDAALADAWRALCEDSRAVFGGIAPWTWGVPLPPRPPFHAQPWAPRRRRRKACRR